MAVLVIGDEERRKFVDVRVLAEANVIDVTSLHRLASPDDLAAFRWMMQSLSVEIPIGYRVTYSHEKQSFGIVKHISISVDRPRVAPATEAIELILSEFGMNPLRKSYGIWPEEVDECIAINIIQPI